jgi:hypothetical protein
MVDDKDMEWLGGMLLGLTAVVLLWAHLAWV